MKPKQLEGKKQFALAKGQDKNKRALEGQHLALAAQKQTELKKREKKEKVHNWFNKNQGSW